MPRTIDLSIGLNAGTLVYPGDKPLSLEWLTRIPKTIYNLSAVQMGPHTGTHVDSPLHFMDGGSPIGQLDPSLFIGEAVCIKSPKAEGQDVTVRDLEGADIKEGDIVLFSTGWEGRVGTQAFFTGSYPGFEPAVIKELARRGVKAVGFDSPSADSPRALKDGAAAHKTAARLSLPIYESLVNLTEVAGRRFMFSGLPLKLTEAEASPVRAVAVLQD